MPVSVVCLYACVLSVHIPVQHTCEYMFISLCMCTCASVYTGMYVCLVCTFVLYSYMWHVSVCIDLMFKLYICAMYIQVCSVCMICDGVVHR